MVLEHLFPENWLEKKVSYAFLLAIVYSIVGIIAAKLLFGANSGIVSVVFTSILLLPSLEKLFSVEEKVEEKEKKITLIEMWKDNQAIIKTYFAIFFGIFLTYMFFSFVLPQLGINTFNIFKEQLFLDPGLRGHAYDIGTFWNILANNWWVLAACFLLGFVTGDGAIFFITWNASAWGTIFGYRALTAAWYSGANPWWYLLIILSIVLWHVILEGGAYILAAISGSVISRDIISKSTQIKEFARYFVVGGGILAILFYVLKRFNSYISTALSIIIFIISVYTIKNTFQDQKHKEVFTYNFWLFMLGLGIFILGALLEAGVLSWSGLLMKLYNYSYLYFG